MKLPGVDPDRYWSVADGDVVDGKWTPDHRLVMLAGYVPMVSPPSVVLIGGDDLACWAVIEDIDVNLRRPMWQAYVYQDKSRALSAAEIAEATATTMALWPARFGRPPAAPLRHESAWPGPRSRSNRIAFRYAGWRVVEGTRGGSLLLEAPGEDARCFRLR